jgi:hypothetical protein
VRECDRPATDDGSPDTEPDTTWLPQSVTTAADPSYPGAHAVVSAAAAEVLASFLHRDRFDFEVTSPTSSNTRSFTSFSDAAREASLSRIFAGQHFRFDQAAGDRLGRDVAEWVLDRMLTRIDGGPAHGHPPSASPALHSARPSTTTSLRRNSAASPTSEVATRKRNGRVALHP